MIPVTEHLALDERDLEERFIRAAGPGGRRISAAGPAPSAPQNQGSAALCAGKCDYRRMGF
jgi:hypothetical protein